MRYFGVNTSYNQYMIDVILVLLLVLMIGGAAAYIVKAKKNGAKCIGCPASATCGAKKGGQSACHCGSHEETNC